MSDNLFHVIVCAAIRNQEGKILLARRKAEKKLGGKWEFPGGKLELGEELEEALKREIKEELNIEIKNIRLLHIKPHTYSHGNVLILFYTADHASGEPELQDHDIVVWCDVNDLKNHDLLEANQEALEKLKGASQH